MKHFAILVFLSFFNSCSKDAVATHSTGYYGKWTLVKMSGTLSNSETTGTAMEWHEFYLLNTDGHLQNREKEMRLKRPFPEPILLQIIRTEFIWN
ncbi:hypothetical protein [Flavobacterium sp. ZS1P14]|uniref:hypothetical protein n=1 Tax=Flavobacterium sp. ZS1P14 TaxID=3401729 RepID=UPI003AABB41A